MNQTAMLRHDDEGDLLYGVELTLGQMKSKGGDGMRLAYMGMSPTAVYIVDSKGPTVRFPLANTKLELVRYLKHSAVLNLVAEPGSYRWDAVGADGGRRDLELSFAAEEVVAQPVADVNLEDHLMFLNLLSTRYEAQGRLLK